MVACDQKHIMFIVPGADWTLDTSQSPPIVVHANSGAYNVSVRLAEDSETQYDVKEHLRAIHAGVAKRTDIGQVGEAHLEAAPHGHDVLWYEIAGTSDGMPFRMINAWTAVRRADRRFVDYHVSLIAPTDDPSWQPQEDHANPTQRVVGMADAFFVLDDDGRPVPQ